MTGLVQVYMFKEKLWNCEPINLGRFDFRERHLEFGHPILMAATRAQQQINLLITDGVHCPQKRLWLLVFPTQPLYVSSRVWLQLLVSWCWLYPCLLGLHSGKRLSEGGIHLIRCLALLYSFGGRHQCRSNPANLLLYGLGFGWSCFGVLRRYYNYEVGQC